MKNKINLLLVFLIVISSITLVKADIDWRNKDGNNWMTSVKDQGDCGSCWAFSAMGTIEAQYNIFKNNPGLDIDLAEEYLVSDCDQYHSSTCCGGNNNDALSYIKTYGATDENCFPYVDSTGCTCTPPSSCDVGCAYSGLGGDGTYVCSDATCSDRCSDWKKHLLKLSSVNAATGANYKTYLDNNGPLSGSLFWSFDTSKMWKDANGVYHCDETGASTNHAIVIVGYNDAGQYWIIKNSWGTGWEDNGYGKIGYGECLMSLLGSFAYGVTPDYPKDSLFTVQYQGANVSTLDQSGDLFLTGEVFEQTTKTPDNNVDEYIIRDTSGNALMIINQSGDLVLKGAIYPAEDNLVPPEGNNFIWRDQTGKVVGYLTETGEMYLDGILYKNW